MQFKNLLVAATVLASAAVGIASPLPVEEPITGGGAEVSIEKRQLAGQIHTWENSIPGLVVKIVQTISALRLVDRDARREFTQRLAREGFAGAGGNAVIVCNVGYQTTGPVLSRTSQKMNLRLGTNVDFDVVVLGRGATFTRQGDGGFENWAFALPGHCRAAAERITC